MNTKFLLGSCAIYLGISGLGLSFIPEEILEYFNHNSNNTSILFLQILGSLYLGFGILNCMTKNNLLGGIYGRPLVIGNLDHFLVSSLALLKMVEKMNLQYEIIILTIIYSSFTLCFGYIFFTNPKKIEKIEIKRYIIE